MSSGLMSEGRICTRLLYAVLSTHLTPSHPTHIHETSSIGRVHVAEEGWFLTNHRLILVTLNCQQIALVARQYLHRAPNSVFVELTFTPHLPPNTGSGDPVSSTSARRPGDSSTNCDFWGIANGLKTATRLRLTVRPQFIPSHHNGLRNVGKSRNKSRQCLRRLTELPDRSARSSASTYCCLPLFPSKAHLRTLRAGSSI